MPGDEHLREAQAAGYEIRDAEPRSLGYFAASLVFLVIFAGGVAWWTFRNFSAATVASVEGDPFATSRPLPPAPRLRVSPALDWATYKQMEERQLETYGWTDEQRGLVHVPIERAMDMLLESGLPARQQEAPRADDPGKGSSTADSPPNPSSQVLP
jgi:hypothetical protein